MRHTLHVCAMGQWPSTTALTMLSAYPAYRAYSTLLTDQALATALGPYRSVFAQMQTLHAQQALARHHGASPLSGRVPVLGNDLQGGRLSGRSTSPSRHCVPSGVQHGPGALTLQTDAQTHTERIVEQFDGRAAAYDNDNTYHPPLADKLLALAAPAAGESVLDIACGTGLVALKAAAAVGPWGRVVGVDLSEGMLQQARTTTAKLGLTNVEWHHGNIEEASFPSASFDIITCSAATPFIRDLPTALKQWRYWLKPGGGGRLAFNSWRAPPGALIDYGTFLQVAAEFGLGIEDPCARLGTEELVEAALQGAGFRDIKVEAEHKERLAPADSPAAYAEKTFAQCCGMNPWHEPLSEHTMPGRFEDFRHACVTRIAEAASARFAPYNGVSSPYTVLHVLAYA